MTYSVSLNSWSSQLVDAWVWWAQEAQVENRKEYEKLRWFGVWPGWYSVEIGGPDQSILNSALWSSTKEAQVVPSIHIPRATSRGVTELCTVLSQV